MNYRRLILVTLISFLLVILLWIIIIMDNDLPISLSSLIEIHFQTPYFLIFDLLPLFVFILLYPMHRIMNRAIGDFESKTKESQSLLDKNSDFAKKMSEGEDPEVFDKMMDTDIGQSLRLIQLNIKSNRRKEREQSWIAEGKDIISKILRTYNNLDELAYNILIGLNNYVRSTQGAIYLFDDEKKILRNIGTYAYNRRKFIDQEIQIGEGLVGQCAYEKDYIYRTEIPDDYVTITSGLLGDCKPNSIVLVPLLTNEEIQGCNGVCLPR